MKQYRLLNEGEKIEKGDDVWDQKRWRRSNTGDYLCVTATDNPARRPLQTGWIKLSERKPTEEDATMSNNNLVVFFRERGGYAHIAPFNRPNPYDTHWHPLPKFEEINEYEEAFEKWWEKVWRGEMGNSPDPINDSCKRSGKTIWHAALAYRDGKK